MLASSPVEHFDANTGEKIFQQTYWEVQVLVSSTLGEIEIWGL